ncbi:MAG: CBS domain-containing protein [Proteobacteria bacterium]|nr:CBS domain-containing protein [Pseudomonadota bacterium]
MQVKMIMTSKVVTIPVTARLEDARTLMRINDIRHLPVVKNGRLVGLVTDRDLRGALFPSMIEDIGMTDLMVANPKAVKPDMSLEEAARVVYKYKIGCLPVVDDESVVVGIVTTSDMLAAFIEVVGFLSSSSRLDVVMPRRRGALEEACHIIEQNGGRVIGVSVSQVQGDQPAHLFRLEKTDLTPIIKNLTRKGYEILSSMS